MAEFRRALALIALVLSLPVFADLYRCVEGGHPVFRDRPCDGSSRIPPGSIPLGSVPQLPAPAQATTPTPSQGNVITGRVVSIADGDTLTLLDSARQQHKIRVSGIDAPEKVQAFGQRSKSNLAALAFDREASAECRKTDRYGRSICVVRVNGKDVGLEQIRNGMAWWYRQYAKDQTAQEREEYERAEFEAKAHRLGLWADKNPIEPWNWRRGTRLDE